MMFKNEEEAEAFQSICKHHGMKLFLQYFDSVIANIERGLISVPLDTKDPEKAALSLYAERMKLDGAIAVKNAIHKRVNDERRRVLDE